MRKYLLPLILVVILLSVGGIYVASQQETRTADDQIMVSGTPAMEKDDSMMKDEGASGDQMIATAAYTPYERGILEKTSSYKRVLFFYANWCPTCKPADASFQANEGKIPDGVRLIRVNYNDTDTDDEEKKLADTYGVTYQHTFIQIDADGKVVTKWNGGQIDELLSRIK